MENETKRQHYVWRKYLAPWTDNNTSKGRLVVANKSSETWSLYGNENNSFLIKLMDIAFDWYFYDISTASKDDFDSAKQITDNLLAKLSQNTPITSNFSFVKSQFSRKDFLEKEYFKKVEDSGIDFINKLVNGVFPFEYNTKALTLIKKLELDIFKSLMTGQESSVSDEELHEAKNESLSNGDPQFEFYQYLMVQYLRTLYVKNQVSKVINDYNQIRQINLTLASYWLTVPIHSFYIANSLVNKGFFIKLLINESNVPFIVTNNPAINYCHDYNSVEEPTEFKVYYPISPKIALKCTNEISHNCKEIISNSETINQLNQIEISSGATQVFSNNKDYLVKLLQLSN